MKNVRRWALTLTVASSAGFAALAACTTEDPVEATGADAGSTADASVAPDSGADEDGGSPSNDAGSGQSFTVPAGGGSVDVQGATMKLTLTFPASAAGKTITFATATSEDIGWPAGQFAEAIKLGPDGERFADPILVVPEKKELVAALLSFGDGATKGAASPVPLKADGSGFELHHFSTLVVVSAGRLCDSEGHNDTPADAYCNGAPNGNTTKRVVTCKGYSYCLNVSLTCCVAPGADAGGCTWADAPLLGTQTPTDSNGGQYPYCEGDAGDWDGGASGCLNPKLTYAFVGSTGCSAVRYECGAGYGEPYEMQCDGGTCQCQIGGNSPVLGPSFAQGAACDNTANMRTHYVQKCNYPAEK